ncbi:EVE domain-containing protein [Andreprevotia chitinilytica]|uniref:EVE domain-containing protein n=1 Tax=Andreprevotia chitinilytica TaxID=396808 RepID=UPI00055960C5|nr:EVE domain-containing protein [Andreprevotia chitinilytica]
MNAPIRYWIAVASAEHARRGRALGFMQTCHGKAAPLRRIKPGDVVIYYAPTEIFGGRDACQRFVSIGRVKEGDVYPFDMGGGFCPHRRDIDYWPSQEVAIRPMLEQLDFTRGKRNWGYAFRFGLLEISAHDGDLIRVAMGT